MIKPFTWSFSALEAYELCPKKYYHERIAKDVFEKTNVIQSYGTDAHKFFEHRMLRGKALPLDLKHHEKYLQKIEQIPGEKLPEQKLAINRSYEPTGFFDSDVYCRTVIDFVIHTSAYAVIFDWKFGRYKPGFDQIKLSAAVFSCYFPDIPLYKGMYYWAKDKKLSPITISRNDVMDIWAEFIPRVNKMEDAVKTTSFPAKKNFLCKRHCPVKSCPYNGG